MPNAPLKAWEIIGAAGLKILSLSLFRWRRRRRNRVLCRGLNTAPQIPIPSPETVSSAAWAARPCWVTSALPDPVPTGGVHLAQEWESHHKKEIRRARSGGVFTGASIGTEGLLLALLFSMMAIFAFVGGAVGAWNMLIVIIVGLLLLAITLIWRGSNHRLADPNFVYPVCSDPRYRLRVVGRRRRLELLRQCPIQLGSTFEPEIFRITFAVEPKYHAGRKMILLFLMGLLVVVMAEFIWGIMPRGIEYATIMGPLCFARFARAFIWPTYLRVVPGRLDVLQYRFLGAGPPRVRSYGLRTSRICIHVNNSLAVFPPDATDGELFPAVSMGWFQKDPIDFERTLLTAALTDLPSPPLPDDELIG